MNLKLKRMEWALAIFFILATSTSIIVSAIFLEDGRKFGGDTYEFEEELGQYLGYLIVYIIMQSFEFFFKLLISAMLFTCIY